ncbi:hypothetical protein CTA2_4040, partial [Colletotrichum tanaceti]
MATPRVCLFSLLIAAGASAFLTEKQYSWQSAGPGDLRSPCPGLNALATQGLHPPETGRKLGGSRRADRARVQHRAQHDARRRDLLLDDFAAAGREIQARLRWGETHKPEFNGTFATTRSLLQYALLLSACGDYGNANMTLV